MTAGAGRQLRQRPRQQSITRTCRLTREKAFRQRRVFVRVLARTRALEPVNALVPSTCRKCAGPHGMIEIRSLAFTIRARNSGLWVRVRVSGRAGERARVCESPGCHGPSHRGSSWSIVSPARAATRPSTSCGTSGGFALTIACASPT